MALPAAGAFFGSTAGKALLSFGSNVLSGMLGRDKGPQRWEMRQAAQFNRKQQRKDLQNLRKAAEGAGFNPLTVLRATGGQLSGGFGGAAVMSSSSAWRGALADGVQAGLGYLIDHDPMAAQREQLEQELMREQISTLQYERAQDQTFGTAPVRNGYGGPVSTSVATGTNRRGAVTASVAPVGFGVVPSPYITPEMRVDPGEQIDVRPAASNEMNTASSGMVAGRAWRANPRSSDVALWEERYGDIGGALAAPLVFGSDLGYNLRLANDYAKAWRGTRAEARTKDWARNEVWGRVQRPY